MCKLLYTVRKLPVALGYTLLTSYSGLIPSTTDRLVMTGRKSDNIRNSKFLQISKLVVQNATTTTLLHVSFTIKYSIELLLYLSRLIVFSHTGDSNKGNFPIVAIFATVCKFYL